MRFVLIELRSIALRFLAALTVAGALCGLGYAAPRDASDVTSIASVLVRACPIPPVTERASGIASISAPTIADGVGPTL
jgi:hypothetical protein